MSQSPDLSSLRWRKATRSAQGNENCVEVAVAGPLIAVRDSKEPDGPHFSFSRREITNLASRIKQGLHDL